MTSDRAPQAPTPSGAPRSGRTAERALEILVSVAETGEVRQQLDLPLYETGLLDSLKTVELIVAMSEAFDIELSPAEFERDEWATPRQIVAWMEQRIGP